MKRLNLTAGDLVLAPRTMCAQVASGAFVLAFCGLHLILVVKFYFARVLVGVLAERARFVSAFSRRRVKFVRNGGDKVALMDVSTMNESACKFYYDVARKIYQIYAFALTASAASFGVKFSLLNILVICASLICKICKICAAINVTGFVSAALDRRIYLPCGVKFGYDVARKIYRIYGVKSASVKTNHINKAVSCTN